jgi:thioredoxin-related protein
MKKYFKMKRSILTILLIVAITSLSLAQTNKTKMDKKPAKVEFKWYTFDEAYALNKKNPKKIFIDVFTDWCGWCVRMDNTTFKDSIIRDYMARNFYPVKFNAERKDTVKYNGQTYVNPYPSNARSTHQLASVLLQGQLSYPSYVILNEKFEVINKQMGYKVAKELEVILHYFGEGAYSKMTYDKFAETFKGTIQ